MTTPDLLLTSKCSHRVQALTESEIKERLSAVNDWSLNDGKIAKTFAFENYYQTLAFVNAAAYIFHIEDHHPELTVTYNRCGVKLDTHSVNGGGGGLTDNDFICAAKLDALYQQAER